MIKDKSSKALEAKADLTTREGEDDILPGKDKIGDEGDQETRVQDNMRKKKKGGKVSPRFMSDGPRDQRLGRRLSGTEAARGTAKEVCSRGARTKKVCRCKFSEILRKCSFQEGEVTGEKKEGNGCQRPQKKKRFFSGAPSEGKIFLPFVRSKKTSLIRTWGVETRATPRRLGRTSPLEARSEKQGKILQSESQCIWGNTGDRVAGE